MPAEFWQRSQIFKFSRIHKMFLIRRTEFGRGPQLGCAFYSAAGASFGERPLLPRNT